MSRVFISIFAALVLLAGMIYLLVRRGYQGETELRHLTAVSAAKM